MPVILCIESATRNCSVALVDDGKVLALCEEASENYVHAERLHPFIQQAMATAGLGFDALEAVAVGAGPGSYTGLRIGVAAAKGLCLARNIPLIAVNTLHTVAGMVRSSEDTLVIPMIDAGRMEVYTAGYDHRGNEIRPVSAVVPDDGFFAEEGFARVLLCGDGAAKFSAVLPQHAERAPLLYPSAAAMASVAEEKRQHGQSEDLAYFEPHYLKDFIAIPPKKRL